MRLFSPPVSSLEKGNREERRLSSLMLGFMSQYNEMPHFYILMSMSVVMHLFLSTLLGEMESTQSQKELLFPGNYNLSHGQAAPQHG